MLALRHRFSTEKAKKPPAARKGPEWHQCRFIDGRVRITTAERNTKSSPRRHWLCENSFAMSAFTDEVALCLSVDGLVNASAGTFFMHAGSTSDARTAVTITGDSAVGFPAAEMACACVSAPSPVDEQAVDPSRSGVLPLRPLRNDGRRDAEERVDGGRGNQSERGVRLQLRAASARSRRRRRRLSYRLRRAHSRGAGRHIVGCYTSAVAQAGDPDRRAHRAAALASCPL